MPDDIEGLLSPKGKPVNEHKDLRALCGFTHPRRKRQQRASEAPQVPGTM